MVAVVAWLRRRQGLSRSATAERRRRLRHLQWQQRLRVHEMASAMVQAGSIPTRTKPCFGPSHERVYITQFNISSLGLGEASVKALVLDSTGPVTPRVHQELAPTAYTAIPAGC